VKIARRLRDTQPPLGVPSSVCDWLVKQLGVTSVDHGDGKRRGVQRFLGLIDPVAGSRTCNTVVVATAR
jgi:hypothetical protein